MTVPQSGAPVAPGVPANLPLPAKVDVYVRVRDLGGRPLRGAAVSSASFPQASATKNVTDALGQVVVKNADAAAQMKVKATYLPNTGKGNDAPTSLEVTVPITLRYDPSPKDAPGTVTPELYVTILLPVRYALTHLFGWQHRTIRERIYIAGQTVEPYLALHPKDDPTRSRLVMLQEFIKHFDPSAAAIAQAQSKLNAATADSNRKDAVAKEAEKTVAKDEKAVGAAEKQANDRAAKAKPKAGTPDPPTNGTTPPDPKPVPEDRYVAAAKKRRDQDQAVAAKHAAELAQSKQRLADAEAALAAAQASHGFASHRAAVTYIFDVVFKNQDIAPWIKFGVMHFSGLRYRPTAGCCEPAEDILYKIRKKELRDKEHPSSSALAEAQHVEAQQRCAREYLAYLTHPGSKAVLDDVGRLYPQKYREYSGKTTKQTGVAAVLELLRTLAQRTTGWLQAPPGAKAVFTDSVYELRAIALATTEQWLKAIQKAHGEDSLPDSPEVHGELCDRYFKDEIPKAVWERIAASTPLINDFFDDRWDVKPNHWNYTPSKAKVDKEWEGVFSPPGHTWEKWFKGYDKTFRPSFTGGVCNDIASMLARARGAASEAESIMSMMRKCFAAGQAARDERKKKAAEAAKAAGSAPGQTSTADGDGTTPVTPPPAADPIPSDSDFAGIFRPQSFAEVRAGDMIFFAVWVPRTDYKVTEHGVVPDHIQALRANPAPTWEPHPHTKDVMAGSPGFAAQLAARLNLYDTMEALYATVTAPGAVAYGVVAGAKGQQVIKAYAKPPPKPAPAKQPAGTPAGPLPTPPAPDPVDPKAFVVDHQHLVYMHIATVVKPEANQLVMLETASPTGIFIRYRDTLLDPTVWFGRLPVPIGPGPPNLSAYLERSRLVDAARLDD